MEVILRPQHVPSSPEKRNRLLKLITVIIKVLNLVDLDLGLKNLHLQTVPTLLVMVTVV